MTKIIVLAEDTWLDGAMRRKGEVMRVSDGFDPTLVRRIIRQIDDAAENARFREKEKTHGKPQQAEDGPGGGNGHGGKAG